MSTTSTLPPLARAALLGLLSGSRSATPLAVLAVNHGDEEARGAWQSWRLFRWWPGRAAFVVAGVGELVGDKLPATPSRIAPGPLVGRVAAGAVVGLAVADPGHGGSRLAGAVVGALGALAGSWLFYLARKSVVDRTGLPDLVVALVEDAVTVSSSFAVVRSR